MPAGGEGRGARARMLIRAGLQSGRKGKLFRSAMGGEGGALSEEVQKLTGMQGSLKGESERVFRSGLLAERWG